jgi:hypothetical protein
MKGHWRRHCGCLVSFTENALGICATCLWMSHDEDKAARYSDSFLRSSLEHFHSTCGDGLRLCECTWQLICTDHWIGWVSFLQLKHLSRPFIYQETNTETIVEFEWPKKRSNNNWLCTSKLFSLHVQKWWNHIHVKGEENINSSWTWNLLFHV